MKRSAYDEDGDETVDYSYASEGPLTPDGRVLEKRARSGSSPLTVGPLVFNSDGTELQQSLFAAQPSSMPGIHRLAAPASAIVRLWSPHWPTNQFMEAPLPKIIQAISWKCIFVFDTRTSSADALLHNVVPVDWLLNEPSLQKWGIVVSRLAPPEEPFGPQHRTPFIQDPIGSLAILCHFYEYLGPSAVCVKNGEVVATTMLSRSPEILHNTLEQWDSI